MSSSNPGALRRLARAYGPHRGGIVLATGLLAAGSAVPGGVVFVLEQLLDEVLLARDPVALAALPFALVGLYLLKALATIGSVLLTRRIGFRVARDLRQRVVEHCLALDLGWHQRQRRGDTLARVVHDAGEVELLAEAYAGAIEKPLSLFFLLAAALWMDWRLTLWSLLVLPFVAVAIDRFARRMRTAARDTLKNLGDLSADLQEVFAGIHVVQAFGGEREQAQAFHRVNDRHVALQLRAALAQAVPGPVVEAIAAAGIGLVLWFGGQRVFAGDLLPGELIGFLVALGLMNMPLKGLSDVVAKAQRAAAGAERSYQVLDQQPAVADGPEVLAAATCGLRFEGVSFDYGDGPVLQALDFTIAPGERVGIVGASGSGKTTLASLVPRFVDPTAGRVLVNGQDLRELTLASLRDHVAVVSQEPFLFHGSVLDNVRLGRPGATRDQVLEALRVANAADFVQGLPQGVDTALDEAGARLSGGERQRICIARAVLADAPVLILDEATSNLDAQSQDVVTEALERLMTDRTTLAIAHRMSTLVDADRILVLRDGRLVEQGRHQELITAQGEYARLWGAAR
jgi:ATP-binding cassette, subfamily B, bacterial MsbA